jgi:hypothetical protein
VAAKQKKAKAGSAPPLQKKYIYWLVAGLLILFVMRGQDLWRFVQSKTQRTSSSASAAQKNSTDAKGGAASENGRALIQSVELLSRLSLEATNQLTVVRYMITANQNQKINADHELAWIPRVVAIYRDGLQSWKIRTADDQVCREGQVLKTGKFNGLRVVYLDDRSVLFCPETSANNPRPQIALPVTRIVQEEGERVLMVDKKRVCIRDHVYFAGWDFEILLIARDRFEMDVKPLDSSEGSVRLYQFVL